MAKKMGTDGLVLARPRKHASLHFGHNYVYGAAPPPPPPPPPGTDWYDWAGNFSGSITETRLNISGSTKSDAPVTFMATFHKGVVPTTKTLQLRDPSGSIVASTHWQWGQRSTFDDGSLHSCVVRCYGPSGWTNNATKQYTVDVISGSWPAETDARSLSTVTGASDFVIELDDITKPQNRPNYNFAVREAQTAWTYPTLEYQNNRALNVANRTRKVTGGAIFSQYVTWEKLKTPDEASTDAELWVKCWTNTWYSPGTDTVVHQSVHPLLMNGRANVRGAGKLAKIRVLNNGSEVHNYADVTTLELADWNSIGGAHYSFTDASTDFAVVQTRNGDAVKMGGSPPSGFTAGNFYHVIRNQEYGPSSAQGYQEYQQKPGLGLCWFGIWGTGGNSAGGSNTLDPGTGGGTHTLTTYSLITDKQVHPIRDGNGVPFWTVGGAVIEPDWTRAERIYRMQTAQIPSVPIDEVGTFAGTWQGLDNNSPYNTALVPAFRGLHKFAPGRILHHRPTLRSSGTFTEAGFHLGECSFWTHNVIANMTNPDPRDYLLIQRQAAAEGISVQECNTYDSNVDGNGNEYPHPIVINNGHNGSGGAYTGTGAGTAYTGLGPLQPNAVYGNVGSALVQRGSYSGSDQQNEMNHVATGGDTGSHNTKECAFSYVMRCDPSDLEAVKLAWTLFATRVAVATTSPTYGRHKTIGSDKYWTAVALGFQNNSGQPRINIGVTYMLSFTAYTPDSEPDAPYWRDLIRTNVDCYAAALADTSVISDRAFRRGIGISLPIGGDQGWIIGRHANCNAILLKRSGRSGAAYEKLAKFTTAMARNIWGAPEGGGTVWSQASGDGFTGWQGFVAGGLWFDAAETYNSAVESDASGKQLHFKQQDDACSVEDMSRFTYGLECSSVSYNADHTVTINGIVNASTHTPVEGDMFLAVMRNSPTPPSAVGDHVWRYIYDVSGTTFKLSSTPGPSWTQVTWGGVAANNISVNNQFVSYASRRAGARPGGLLQTISHDYLYETFCAVPTVKTCFGAEHCDDALTKHGAFEAYYEDASGQGAGDSYYYVGDANVYSAFKAYGPGAT